MNKTIVLALSALLTLACNTASTDAVAQQGAGVSAKTKGYGAAITPDGAISTAEFAKKMATRDSLATKLECEIITSCTRKGCWMDVKMPNGGVMKVRFKDYGFFVPTKGLEGRQAVLQGYAVKEKTDVATLRHYAEDAGKSKEEIEKITAPEESLSFEADGVLITF
ncbi:MAG TPA: DUF4920 domain-containing protein [Flavobacteriales bacterium]|nr:DUF4920 domain-containing protein [Flavobacteriales bacterium]